MGIHSNKLFHTLIAKAMNLIQRQVYEYDGFNSKLRKQRKYIGIVMISDSRKFVLNFVILMFIVSFF